MVHWIRHFSYYDHTHCTPYYTFYVSIATYSYIHTSCVHSEVHKVSTKSAREITELDRFIIAKLFCSQAVFPFISSEVGGSLYNHNTDLAVT